MSFFFQKTSRFPHIVAHSPHKNPLLSQQRHSLLSFTFNFFFLSHLSSPNCLLSQDTMEETLPPLFKVVLCRAESRLKPQHIGFQFDLLRARRFLQYSPFVPPNSGSYFTFCFHSSKNKNKIRTLNVQSYSVGHFEHFCVTKMDRIIM